MSSMRNISKGNVWRSIWARQEVLDVEPREVATPHVGVDLDGHLLDEADELTELEIPVDDGPSPCPDDALRHGEGGGREQEIDVDVRSLGHVPVEPARF
jgi:hypothetical protein